MVTDRTEDEIDAIMNEVAERGGVTKWRGMTYEEGVRAAIEWLFEDGPNPLED